MKLLYCRDGVVLAWHESDQPVVPASAYGDDVRIIPYPDRIADLPRLGELPPPLPDGRPYTEQNDPRPYGEPPETPELLKGFAGQVRWDTTTAGILFGSVPANTDRISQTQISALAQYATTLSPTDHIDFTQDGVAYVITAQNAIDMNQQMTALAQQCRTVEAQCLVDLSSGSPTIATYEDVETRFAGLQARTLRGKKN